MCRILLFRQPDSSGQVIRIQPKGALSFTTGSLDLINQIFDGLDLKYGQEREIEIKRGGGCWTWESKGYPKRRLPGNAGQVNTRARHGGGFGKVIKASVEEHKKEG